MQLFTEIEFRKDEFDKIEKVLYFLITEGWNIINEVEHSVTFTNQEKTIISKKYFFKREI